MAEFKLKKGNDTFTLDSLGSVKDAAGQALGKWGTDSANKVVVTKTAGGTVTLDDVIWKFNDKNQLCLNVGNTEVFNFHQPGSRPFYATTDAVLNIRPDRNNVFGFSLHGEWDLNEQHDLSVTINNVKSTLDGFIQDARGRFMFHFFDKGAGTIEESVLGFAGAWRQDNADALKLIFTYKREDGTDDEFALPKSIAINRTLNQFMYEYDKAGQTFRLQFMGLLKISEDFVLSYALDQQRSSTGAVLSQQTTLTIKAEITKQNFSGNVDFKVTKAGGQSTTISLRGSFTAVHQRGVKLSVGFAFDQTTSQGRVTTTFAFNGKLEFGTTGSVQWTFQKNATTTSVTISATDITLGPARLDGSLNLVRQNGQLAGVRVLFGVVL
jgi:hypothetical protein